VVCPGTRLGPATELQPGHGTYVLGNFIYASVAGILQRSEVGSHAIHDLSKALRSSRRPALTPVTFPHLV